MKPAVRCQDRERSPLEQLKMGLEIFVVASTRLLR